MNAFEMEDQDEQFVLNNCVSAYLADDNEEFVVDNCVAAYLS
ncbi:hypothetical protein ABZX62_05970 [Streptomyces flavidovirens]|uniref:Uncharacterized protein n=1 Tax=Streptomyces flavidovirens TaxID=67298 RepID=A0ABW6RF46_9ACTN|nr:hypothetical protein [Streptomyces flavidovirens]